MHTIYLDHNATTPMHPEVVAAVAAAMERCGANPASSHQPGQQARRMLEDARQEVAQLLGADLHARPADRVIFTSGGTEANNLAVLGACRARSPAAPGQLVISAIEHPSVIEPAESLLDEGWRLDCLGVDRDGVVRTAELPGLLTSATALVSVLLGSHETGVLQPLAEVARLCAAAHVPLHTDAVQVAGKLPIDFRALGVGALSVAAHKFRGPLGIGALVLRHDYPLRPLLHGGAQQQGLRPGTEAVPLAVGMATALRLWKQEADAHAWHLAELRDRFERELQAAQPGLVINGSRAARLPNTSNVAFPGLDGQVLLVAFDVAGVACSAGSACKSGSSELSPTLRAMGVPPEVLAGSLRFSLGGTTTAEEIDTAVRRIADVCRQFG